MAKEPRLQSLCDTYITAMTETKDESQGWQTRLVVMIWYEL